MIKCKSLAGKTIIRKVAVVLAFASVAFTSGIGMVAPASADEIVTYTTDSSNNVTVTGCAATCPADLVIPESLGGNPVTAIDYGVFAYVGLTSVLLPSSLINIGDHAFRGNSLTSVTIPASVTSLGYYSFYENSLKTVKFEGDAPTDGGNVFDSNPDLPAVDVNYGTTGWNETYSFVTVNVIGSPTPTPSNTPTANPTPDPVECWDGSIAYNGDPCSTPVFCWDGTEVYDYSGCSPEPVQCWDGSTAYNGDPCSNPIQCWDGSTVPDYVGCSTPETCWDGSLVPDYSYCTPEPVLCWDGSTAYNGDPCSTPFYCWDGTEVYDYSGCSPQPVQCWDGSTAYNGDPCSTPVFCWDGTEVYDYSGCSPEPVQCWDGSTAYNGDPCSNPIQCWDGSTVPDYVGCSTPVTCWDSSQAADYAGCPPIPSVVGKPASAAKIVSAKVGNGRVRLSIAAPRRNGGTDITGYEYTVDDGATWTAVDPSSTATSLLITGLDNGTKYVVKVRAVNGAGGGAASKARSFTPRTVASAAVITALTAGNGRIKVEFDVPENNGGATITRYGYSINGGPVINLGKSSSPVWIKGLKNGLLHSVQIYALNAAGWGAGSEAVEATPHR